eukprot:gene1073-406_t
MCPDNSEVGTVLPMRDYHLTTKVVRQVVAPADQLHHVDSPAAAASHHLDFDDRALVLQTVNNPQGVEFELVTMLAGKAQLSVWSRPSSEVFFVPGKCLMLLEPWLATL